jgi:two-component system response regulator AtoC
MAKILVADDEVTSVAIMKKVLEDSGHTVSTVTDGKMALAKIKQFEFDVLVTDFNMPGMNGIQLTKEVLELESDLIVVLITAYATIKSCVEAIKLGAFDYLTKPINKEELVLTVNRGLEKVEIINENILLKQELEKSEIKDTAFDYATTSPQIKSILKEVAKVAKSESTVLITGENGTGKEVLAKYIYHNSKRSSQPFIVVNCAAIPNQLLESELFGHVKGAFTGAINDHKGYFEIANNGTIFLDEIGEIELLMQVKLLRVLQEREFSKVGDTKIRTTNVRIIAATNRILKDMIEDSKFREDLYYRLNVFEFHLPALRERPEDIIYYFEKFLSEFAKQFSKPVPKIDPEVEGVLVNYSWPGNIRELKNLAERVSILCETNIITPDLIPTKYFQFDDGEKNIIAENNNDFSNTEDYNAVKDKMIKDFEINFIKNKLKHYKGNVAATAKAINFHPVSLRQKLAKLGIDPKEFKS